MHLFVEHVVTSQSCDFNQEHEIDINSKALSGAEPSSTESDDVGITFFGK